MDFFLVVNNNKEWEYIVENIIFGAAYPINLWQSLKTHFYVYYLFDFFLVVNNDKDWEYVVYNIIFGIVLPDLPMTIFENTFLCILFIWFLLSPK